MDDPLRPSPTPPMGHEAKQLEPPHWMSGDYHVYVAGIGHRILATLIDWWLLWMIGWTLVFFAFLSPVFGSLAMLVFGILYFVLMPWVFGGTLGKLMVGLRITTSGGQEVPLIKLMAREIIGKGMTILALAIFLGISLSSLSTGTLAGLAAFTVGGGLFVALGRSWWFHDRMFDTMVVRLEKVQESPGWAPAVKTSGGNRQPT